MPSILLPYVNIVLDSFALVVVLTIFVACIGEFSKKNMSSRNFMLFQISIIAAIIFDIVAWVGEGHPELWIMTVTANTVSACAYRLALIGFMGYLIAGLYVNSRAAMLILNIYRFLCSISILFCIGNAFYGFVYFVTSDGHYEHTGDISMGIIYLLFPILSVFALILLALFANRTAKLNRFAFSIYTVIPTVTFILDYVFHGISLTCVGFAIMLLVIYTSIYIQRQKELEAQKNALMLSQINPHFIYNTLSAIAAMCESSPKQAKYLTIDFSKYLRSNIDTMTSDSLVEFEREIEHVECYLKIEKVRFGERLNVIYSIGSKDFKIPPLTIQPLVENAVKHGITKRAEGGTIKICTYEIDKHYVIKIIDDGVGFNSDETEFHVGLKSVENRISAMCHGSLTLKSTVGIGTRVTVLIPKKKGKS